MNDVFWHSLEVKNTQLTWHIYIVRHDQRGKRGVFTGHITGGFLFWTLLEPLTLVEKMWHKAILQAKQF